MTKLMPILILLCTVCVFAAPPTFTPNDVWDDRIRAYAFTGATVMVDPDTRIELAVLLIRNGLVVDVGDKVKVPAGYTEIKLDGHMIYPAFIDLHSSYGLPPSPKPGARSFSGPEVIGPRTPGAFSANDAIKAHYRAATEFKADEKRRKTLRDLGFAVVLTHRPDGIARGVSALVTLSDGIDNELIIAEEAGAHYSFKRGTSRQNYPSSPMGGISLLRQTRLDGVWYASDDRGFIDQSLVAWNATQSLPQFFEVDNWKQLLRVSTLAREFGFNYIVRSGGDDYQRIDAIKGTGLALILPLSFPKPFDVDDPFDADLYSLTEMKHWELAPGNAAAVAGSGIDFALTASGAEKSFWTNLRTAIKRGLSEEEALRALTLGPAKLLGVEKRLGHLAKGTMANFLVASGELFSKDTVLYENWIDGQRHVLKEQQVASNGLYDLNVGAERFELTLSGLPGPYKAIVKRTGDGDDTDKEESKLPTPKLRLDGDFVSLSFSMAKNEPAVRLSGWISDQDWQGKGQSADGQTLNWSATRTGDIPDAGIDGPDDESDEATEVFGDIPYPFTAFGTSVLPEAESILIKNASVWTLEQDGISLNTDVLIREGKIREIGSAIQPGRARIIDGTGMHLTHGIIDEHSHLALDGVNDVAVNSAMVRMSDVVDSEDINIYRALAGGTTAAQLLHGSANPIGGQSALIKMRWGSLPRDMLIEGADGFIKFALGENVKRSRNSRSIRYPQTRMGVEQVYEDWFTAARAYQQKWSEWNDLSRSRKRKTPAPRRDLVLEAMAEILSGERYVTCHSYVQSEINMLMKVAERFNFRINTFTHIMEGYKVADKMVAHGAGGSTFADNWAYKWEVRYAIPYNSALMAQAGVTVAVNSDSSERIRRLNQEAAKAIKYGDMSEVEALKLVTLNPAKLLHLADRMGSIKVGKDADLVLWADHPLSIYAVPEKTIVDGVVYFDRKLDQQRRVALQKERHRLVQKLRSAKGGGGALSKRGTSSAKVWQCDSIHGYEHLLANGGRE
jgi:imidazolonepropionase-like amidohydrolase